MAMSTPVPSAASRMTTDCPPTLPVPPEVTASALDRSEEMSRRPDRVKKSLATLEPAVASTQTWSRSAALAAVSPSNT